MVKKKVTKTTVTETIDDSKKKRKRKSTARKTTKKKVKKKATRKKTSSAGNKQIHDLLKKALDKQDKRDTLLVENFVGLQKAMATLSVRFSELSQNMNTMLRIFEQSAKILAESEKQVDKTLTTKLDALIEQNKNISREINLVDSKIRRTSVSKPSSPAMYSRQMPQTQAPSQSQGLPPKELPQP
jgi:ABC-type transporter Mla subunit MlaD